MTPRIKVCGLTRPDEAQAAAAAGADAIGFILWSGSPRSITVEAAREIAALLPPFVWRVGVFVDADRAAIAHAVDTIGLDLLQLHGDEAPEALAGLPRRALKALPLVTGEDLARARRYAACGVHLLVDAREPGRPGGTGQRCDWTLAARLRAELPFLGLAGGLDALNVAEAVASVRPDLLDVSTGVESAPGRKDAGRVRAFAAAVRLAVGVVQKGEAAR